MDTPYDGGIGLRIGSVFIIFATSLFATMFPVVTKRIPRLNIPVWAYDICRYFGSGVILSTAFMHLLEPAADDELNSPCLSSTFQNYPFAFLFCLLSSLCIWFLEMIAFRVGSIWAGKLAYDPHAEQHLTHVAPENNTGIAVPGDEFTGSPEERPNLTDKSDKISDEEWGTTAREVQEDDTNVTAGSGTSQIIGVAILEFGVIFHSVIIGLTLGSTSTHSDFVTLFIVIIFHQMFEGLGLGVRLAFLPLKKGSWIPYIGALAYPLVTPIGEAIGIGVRKSYNGNSATANYVTGTLDSVSAGILCYTAFVELIAHDFVFNDKMRTAPIWLLILDMFYVFLGAGLMALLAKWA